MLKNLILILKVSVESILILENILFTCLFQEHGGCCGPVRGAESSKTQMFKDACSKTGTCFFSRLLFVVTVVQTKKILFARYCFLLKN